MVQNSQSTESHKFLFIQNFMFVCRVEVEVDSRTVREPKPRGQTGRAAHSCLATVAEFQRAGKLGPST